MDAADPDDPQAVRTAIEQRDKIVANLKARCALAGFELFILGTGTFFVQRWGRGRELRDAAAVDEFLRRLGGR
jgi:hypothetical protein